jgi:uncharacterized protein YaiI (UPF0178 family)
MTRLYIDADACPVTRTAISIARSRGVEVTLVGNSTQDFSRYTSRDGVDAVTAPSGRDAADFAIVEMLEPDDIVVTQDIGLAAMVLGRSARAVSPRGRVYHPIAIDAQLAVRHEEQKVRRAGGRTRGPTAFTDEDRERFADALKDLFADARSE